MGIILQAGVVVVIGVVIWNLWRAAQPHRYFTIRLVKGEPKAVKGQVTTAVLSLVRDVARFNGVEKGWISGVPGPMGIRLEFSRSIPEAARQQIRNGWGTLGWKVGAAKGRRRC
jgi:Protein of unknown function (DUF3634)